MTTAKMMFLTLALAGGLTVAACEKKPTDPKKEVKDAGNPIAGAVDKTKEAVKEGADQAKEAIKDGADKAKEVAKEAEARFVEESQKQLDNAKTQFEALKTKAKDVTDPVKKVSLEGIIKGIEGEFGTLTSKFNALKSAPPAEGATLATEFSALVKKITDGIASAMSQIGK